MKGGRIGGSYLAVATRLVNYPPGADIRDGRSESQKLQASAVDDSEAFRQLSVRADTPLSIMHPRLSAM
jgi:hypothetical protein